MCAPRQFLQLWFDVGKQDLKLKQIDFEIILKQHLGGSVQSCAVTLVVSL